MKFEASTFIEKGDLVLLLNDKVVLEGSGRCVLEISKGKNYQVFWEIKGEYGIKYTISISSPIVAETYLNAEIPITGVETGSKQFKI